MEQRVSHGPFLRALNQTRLLMQPQLINSVQQPCLVQCGIFIALPNVDRAALHHNKQTILTQRRVDT